MKTLRVVALALFLASLGAVIAYAQADNSCVYPYSFVNTYGDSFGFCLTKYGTLASLQSPLGNEQLDPANPLEGFELYDQTEAVDLFLIIFPGFNVNQGPPAVTQPKGPGKLPIVFNYGHVTSTVTATPSDKTVVFTMKVGRIVWQKYTWGDGPFWRMASPLVDGLGNDIFENSGFAAFAYNPTGHGVMIGGAYYSQREGSGEALGFAQVWYGQNVIRELAGFDTLGRSTAVFSYKVF